MKVEVALRKQSSFSSPSGALNATLTMERSFYGKTTMLRHGAGNIQPPFVSIQVIDTGHGIAPHNLPRVFNEIIQFNAGELQNGGGSGLGLWISKSIVEMHGGAVSVYSEGEGRGCTFTMELPAAVYESSSGHDALNTSMRPPAKAPLPAPQMTPNIIAKSSVDVPLRVVDVHDEMLELSVLVVDDAALNRKMLSRLIGGRFKSVVEAEDGKQALEIVMLAINESEEVPDIILMDFIMPVMDGPTASKAIRDIGYKGIIIGVTGNALPADIDTFLSHGADRVLTKPFRLEILLRDILELRESELWM